MHDFEVFAWNWLGIVSKLSDEAEPHSRGLTHERSESPMTGFSVVETHSVVAQIRQSVGYPGVRLRGDGPGREDALAPIGVAPSSPASVPARTGVSHSDPYPAKRSQA